MLITERVEGFGIGKGKILSYRDLRQRNPNMRSCLRNFRTSGVVLCINENWFSEWKTQIADRLVEVFVREYSMQAFDIGSAATKISVRGLERNVSPGNCIAVFDQTYGSLRLTEKFYTKFEHILDRCIAAIESEEGVRPLGKHIANVKQVFQLFSASDTVEFDEQDPVTGFDQVFTAGSRVLYREHGVIGSEVEIIQPTLMDGTLMYQVKPRRESKVKRRWVKASAVEPSGEADTWELAWWNRETETFEDPPS